MSKKILFTILIVLLIFTSNAYAISMNLDIKGDTDTVEVNKTIQLKAEYWIGNDIWMEDMPNGGIGEVERYDVTNECTWSSNNESVAQVDETGKVTGISEGTATISAYYSEEDRSADYEIKVINSTEPRITDKQLSDVLQRLVQEHSDDSSNVKITVENKTINFSSDDYSFDFTLDYDLTDNPTFTYTLDIQKGMSYDDFNEKIEGLSLPLLGYLAVANIQGAEYDDILNYVLEYIIYSAFSNMSNIDASNSYMILEDGVTYTGNDKNVIKKSEFGDHVIEYVDSMYKEKSVYDDSDALNSFEWTTEKQDISADSRKLISTLTVKLDADFSKLAEYNTEEEYTPSPSSSPSSSYKNGYSQEDPNKQPTVLPKAGMNYILLISAVGCLIIANIIRIKLKKYKDIK